MKLIYNKIFLEHDTGNHPENKERLKYFYDLKDSEIKNGEEFIELVHSKDYINQIKECSSNGISIDPDTILSKRSYEVSCYAVGASIKAAEEEGFALVRPPGHHACYNRAMGFCIFNNMAIVVKHLVNQGKKVFVLDFDLHHGNGTQSILENEKNAFYFSLHQSPLYPGTGLMSGKNYINIPLKVGTEDEEYIKVLNGRLIPALERFNPDVIGVSAGFDSYIKDYRYMNPMGGFRLTRKSYEEIDKITKRHKRFFLLEGGYNPLSIKEGVEVFIRKV